MPPRAAERRASAVYYLTRAFITLTEFIRGAQVMNANHRSQTIFVAGIAVLAACIAFSLSLGGMPAAFADTASATAPSATILAKATDQKKSTSASDDKESADGDSADEAKHDAGKDKNGEKDKSKETSKDTDKSSSSTSAAKPKATDEDKTKHDSTAKGAKTHVAKHDRVRLAMLTLRKSIPESCCPSGSVRRRQARLARDHQASRKGRERQIRLRPRA